MVPYIYLRKNTPNQHPCSVLLLGIGDIYSIYEDAPVMEMRRPT